MSMLDQHHARAAIRDFINRSINIESLGDDENLFDSGIVNSLFAVELLTFVERQFGVEVGMDDLDIENFKSINATAAFIARKVASPAA
jgi:acyl carrier protein